MPSTQAMQFLFGILVGFILSFVVGTVWRTHLHMSTTVTGLRDDVLIALLALASFGMGVFLTYALLMVAPGY